MPLGAMAMLVLAGCDGPINIVGMARDARLPSHPEITVGKAFESAFPDGTWTSWGSGMGENFAEFHATATAEVLAADGVPDMQGKECIDGVQSPCRIPVKFQFWLSGDGSKIELQFIDAPERVTSGAKAAALVGLVYRRAGGR
jgi:hypothetical protein